MGKYQVNISLEADEDFRVHRKNGNKAIIKKINRILNELCEHPETGSGKPEKLKYHLSGYWSRQISSEHRVIYTIDQEECKVWVISAFGHYE